MATPSEQPDALPMTGNDGPIGKAKATQLEQLTAQATAKYAMKDYNTAAELYAFATELQADLYGEMASTNADLLYAYGRCLYHVAVRKSDVLGLSKAAGDDREASNGAKHKAGRAPKQALHSEGSQGKVAEDTVKPAAEDQRTLTKPDEQVDGSDKPYFQFTGDENFEDSDDAESQGNEDDEEDAVDEDDFSIAFEVLDMARLLLQKRKDEIEVSSTGIGNADQGPGDTRQITERLADTYDLQAEISLEGEKFPAAVTDLKSALELKLAIYPYESSVIAEAHYKLSLALEFASVTQQKDDQGETTDDPHIDEGMRAEAAHELEAAIGSCKLRIEKEASSLSSDPGINEAERKDKIMQIEDVKDMVKELSQRLVEIRQAPVSINASTSAETSDGSNPVTGLLGSLLGDSLASRQAKLEEASRNAHDLTGLVKKKKSEPTEASNQSDLGGKESSKRKSELPDQSEAGTEKKARLESNEGG